MVYWPKVLEVVTVSIPKVRYVLQAHSPRYLNLISCLPIPQFSFHHIPKSLPFERSASAIDYDHDIAQTASQVIMPITRKVVVDNLACRGIGSVQVDR